MSYSNITNKYKLESPGIGEVLTSSSERRTNEIIDNQLFGGIRSHSGGHGLIRFGDLSIQGNTTTGFSILIAENKAQGKPVVEAFIDQIYVFTNSTLSWTGLSASSTYFLGVQLVENSTSSSLQNTDVQTWSNSTGIIPPHGLLIAVVTLDGVGNPSYNLSPANQILIPLWGNHIIDNQNPHTPYLQQDELVVSGIAILDYLKYRTLQIDSLIISGTGQIISGNITVLGQLILSGNVIVNGNITYNLLRTENMVIPGTFKVSNLEVSSGLDVYSNSLFRKNIQLTSGTTIDGLDPSLTLPLLNGSNVDDLHGHVLGSLGVGEKPLFYSPDYANTVTSGQTISGSFSTVRLFNRNYYQWFASATGVAVSPVTRQILPQDFNGISRISVNHGVGHTLSGNNITVQVFDKDNTQVGISPNNGVLQSTQVTSTDLTISGGQFSPEQAMTVLYRMAAASGVGSFLGDATIFYIPIHGEKILFDWNKNGSITSAEEHFNGLRIAPADLVIEKVLASQKIALSGNSVFDVNVSTGAGIEPTTIFTSTSKPMLSFGSVGSSYNSVELIPTQNLIITKNSLISAGIDLIASGSMDVNLTLVTHRR